MFLRKQSSPVHGDSLVQTTHLRLSADATEGVPQVYLFPPWVRTESVRLCAMWTRVRGGRGPDTILH